MSRRWMQELPHDVYEILDHAEQVIYVGISMNTERRLLQHRSKPWFPLASEARIASYPSMTVAKHVEGRRISEHNPTWNSQKERRAASMIVPAEMCEPITVKVVKL